MQTKTHEDLESILITAEQIKEKVAQLGAQISQDYKGKDLLLIAVLKGSVVFMADLMRAITIPAEIDFLAVSSYNTGTVSSGVVKILKDIDIELAGKDVLIVEDILDSGKTLSYLKSMLSGRNPASVRVVTLLDKPARRTADIQPEYCGFEVPDEFLVGYGLDYSEAYRHLPDIGVLKASMYS